MCQNIATKKKIGDKATVGSVHNERSKMRCTGCKEERPPDAFSGAQRKKPAAKRKCLACAAAGVGASHPAPAAAGVPPQQLQDGARVAIKGLVGRAELNGQHGTIAGSLSGKGRWVVLLDTGGSIAAKPGNLSPSSAPAPRRPAPPAPEGAGLYTGPIATYTGNDEAVLPAEFGDAQAAFEVGMHRSRRSLAVRARVVVLTQLAAHCNYRQRPPLRQTAPDPAPA